MKLGQPRHSHTWNVDILSGVIGCFDLLGFVAFIRDWLLFQEYKKKKLVCYLKIMPLIMIMLPSEQARRWSFTGGKKHHPGGRD